MKHYIEKRGYKWGKVRDGNNVVIDIECRNRLDVGPSHRCARMICECDRILALGLAHTHAFWNITYHARWTPLTPSDPGFFDKGQDCVTNGGNFRQDDCCGAYGSASTVMDNFVGTWPFRPYMRRPYATSNPTNGCCQDVFIYDVANQECCIAADDSVSITAPGDCVAAGGATVDPDTKNEFDYSKKK